MMSINSANHETIERFKEYEKIYNEKSERNFKFTLTDGKELIGKIKIIPGTIFSDNGVDIEGFPKTFVISHIKGNKNQQEDINIDYNFISKIEIDNS